MGIKTLATQYTCDRCGHVHEHDETTGPLPGKWGQVQFGCSYLLLCPVCNRGLGLWLQWVPKEEKPTKEGKLVS